MIKKIRKLISGNVGVISMAILIFAAMLLSPVSGTVAFGASVYNLSVSDGSYVSGVAEISATSTTKSEKLTVKVDGETVSALTAEPTITVHYVTNANSDNTMKAANKLRVGNSPEEMADEGDAIYSEYAFSGDGVKGVKIPISKLSASGRTYFRTIIGSIYGSNRVYNTNKPHGLYYQADATPGGPLNIWFDDFTVQGFYLSAPGGVEIDPETIILYKGKAIGEIGYNAYSQPYDTMKQYWLGDGWNDNEAYDGNTNPRLNIPFMTDFIIDYDIPENVFVGKIDTTTLSNGEHTVTLYADGAVVKSSKIIVDNSNPTISTALADGQKISNGHKITATFNDDGSGIESGSIILNSQEIGYSSDSVNGKINVSAVVDSLSDGVYTLAFLARDKTGNETYLFRRFYIGDINEVGYDNASFDSNTLNIVAKSDSDNVKVYEANPIKYNMGYGINVNNQTPTYTKYNNYDDYYTFMASNGSEPVSLETSLGNPYQSFELDVAGVNGNVVIAFDGGTQGGEKFAIKAYNVLKNNWVTVANGVGEEKLSFTLNTTQYALNDKINLVVTLDYVDNGSNRMLWFSDPQYLTKFADLNYIYDGVMQYSASEYLKGNAAYLVTTGDIVEDNTSSAGDSVIKSQWDIVKKAFSYVDDVGMPYGIVTGNHDTSDNFSALEYDYYKQKFGEKFYNTSAWYGGGLNDNISHFDLVTVGGYDFVVLYLGYGVENHPDTIAWANAVLSQYSHRNGIIATHAFLLGDGSYDSSSRYQSILSDIVIPNENVKFLLCGHNEGAAYKNITLPGGRSFTAYLADYQFVELEKYNTSHIINGYTCNGEGYIREIIIETDKIKMDTFTPIFETDYKPYGKSDTFEMKMSYITPDRMVTTNSLSAFVLAGEQAVTDLGDNQYSAEYSGDKRVVAEITDEDGNVSYSRAFAISVGNAPNKPSLFNTEYMIFKEYFDAFKSYVTVVEAMEKNPYTTASFTLFKAEIGKAEALNLSASSTDNEIYKSFTSILAAYNALDIGEDNTPIDPDDPEDGDGCGSCNSAAIGTSIPFVIALLGLPLVFRRRKNIGGGK